MPAVRGRGMQRGNKGGFSSAPVFWDFYLYSLAVTKSTGLLGSARSNHRACEVHTGMSPESRGSVRCSHRACEVHTGLSLESLGSRGSSRCSHCAYEMQVNILSLSNPLGKYISRKAMNHNQKSVWKVPRMGRKHLTADIRRLLTKSLLWVMLHYAPEFLEMYLHSQEKTLCFTQVTVTDPCSRVHHFLTQAVFFLKH